MTFKRNTRLHPNATVPVADAVVEDTNGAVTLTVPAGASGIMFQNLGANSSYWSLDGAMSAVDTGFKISTMRQAFWFSPVDVTSIYLFLHNDDLVIYQFVAPVAY